MNISFRVDSSKEIGTGHVMRCLTLADEMRKYNIKSSFICRELEGNITEAIKQKGYEVFVLPFEETNIYIKKDMFSSEEYTFFLERDLKQTISVLKSCERNDWLVVDHYGLEARWEKSIQNYVDKILVIDDLANRNHDCDILIDSAYGEVGERYKQLLPKQAIGLFGINYVMLRSQFTEFKKKYFSFNKKINIHLFFGGNDTNNYTSRFSELLLENFSDIYINAVVGENYLFKYDLNRIKNKYHERFIWDQNISNMSEHMSKCDLAIGAAGTTTWERSCIGLPAAYLITSSNQKKILENLAEKEFCVLLGDARNITDEKFLFLIDNFLRDTQKLERIFYNGVNNIDGFGVKRIIDILLSLRG